MRSALFRVVIPSRALRPAMHEHKRSAARSSHAATISSTGLARSDQRGDDPLVLMGIAAWFVGRVRGRAGTTRAYVAAAIQVRRHFSKDSGENLAIPTWAYSNEPTGQFSSAIGKYFANSIREDGLLAIASDGVIFARGSQGTCRRFSKTPAITR